MGVLKFLEKIGMQERQLDGVFDGLERRLPSTNLSPTAALARYRDNARGILRLESISSAIRSFEWTRTSSPSLRWSEPDRRNAVVTIDCNPCSEPTRNRSLPITSVTITATGPVLQSEITYNNESFIDKHARPLF